MTDIEILRTVAEYRVLTVPQTTALMFSSDQVARRRLRKLKEKGLLASAPRCLRGEKGRPENVIFVSSEGYRLLVSGKLLPAAVSYDSVGASKLHCVDHQLLVNWFRIHLLRIDQAGIELRLTFLSSSSPFAQDREGRSILQNQVERLGLQDERRIFIPDGAFCITRRGDRKSLLFFLEVDMSTETLAGKRNGGKDIAQKVRNYRTYLGRKLYKRYEQVFRARFRGFRLLLVADTKPRMEALCRVVRQARPSEFVWVTCQDRVLADGLKAAVWCRTGDIGSCPARIVREKSISGEIATDSLEVCIAEE